MKVHLKYGQRGLDVDVRARNVRVIEPEFSPGLSDEAAAFRQAVRSPIGTKPLSEIVRPSERIAVVIPDVTRHLPNERLLGWLFEELDGVRPEQVTIVSGTGSHRPNTPAELIGMVGKQIFSKYRIVNHDAHDPGTHARAGSLGDGQAVFMNREYVEADRRIVLGFIEPHFMAGFSGGYKGVFPAVADIAAITHYHRAEVIAHPKTTWGVLEGNPTQRLIREGGSLLPLDFLINVTLNREGAITRFFCGHPLEAHEAGAAFVKQTAMAACEWPFDVVVTSNAGAPLDQNLYQAVKGMSAAAEVVKPGGLILTAARCNDGFPEHGNFKSLLFQHPSMKSLLNAVLEPGFSLFDQWQAQILATISERAKIGLYSELSPQDVRRAHLEPVADLAVRIDAAVREYGADLHVAVLPEGPMTIPYLRQPAA